MRSITRNVFRVGAAALAALLAASMSAEVHRFTEDTLTLLIRESLDVPEVYAEPEAGASGSDAQPRAFSAERLVERLPQLATVVIADEGEGLPMTVRAVFAVGPEGAQPGGEIPVEIGLRTVQGVYAVREADRARLAAWLGARTAAFVAGDVVLDRIEGSDAPAEVRVGDTAASGPPHPWTDVGEPFSGGLEHLRGQTFRDISFTTLGREGETGLPAEIRFEDLAGNVVLVHAWATWCAPCLKRMPGLEGMQARYADRGFTILNVSDEPADVLLAWLAKNPSAMLHARRSDMSFLTGPGVDTRAGVPRPVYLVLDRAGVVREVMVGAVSAVGEDQADGKVDLLTELVQRHL